MTAERFRTIISTVLIVGVTLSGVLVAAGFAGSFAVGWDGSLGGPLTGLPAGGPASGLDPTDFGFLWSSLVALRPVGLAQAGLVVLIATPVVRVAASVVAFALEGDRLYAGITLVVLAILLASLFVLR